MELHPKFSSVKKKLLGCLTKLTFRQSELAAASTFMSDLFSSSEFRWSQLGFNFQTFLFDLVTMGSQVKQEDSLSSSLDSILDHILSFLPTVDATEPCLLRNHLVPSGLLFLVLKTSPLIIAICLMMMTTRKGLQSVQCGIVQCGIGPSSLSCIMG